MRCFICIISALWAGSMGGEVLPSLSTKTAWCYHSLNPTGALDRRPAPGEPRLLMRAGIDSSAPETLNRARSLENGWVGGWNLTKWPKMQTLQRFFDTEEIVQMQTLNMRSILSNKEAALGNTQFFRCRFSVFGAAPAEIDWTHCFGESRRDWCVKIRANDNKKYLRRSDKIMLFVWFGWTDHLSLPNTVELQHKREWSRGFGQQILNSS